MLSELNLQEIIGYKSRAGSPTLSVYLDIDQSNAANLNRKFEVSLFNALREEEEKYDGHGRSDLQEGALRVQKFVEGYRPRAKGLVVFCDPSDDFFRAYELQVPVKTEARWSEKPYLRPPLEMIDEHEPD